jgi:hypothetical protein
MTAVPSIGLEKGQPNLDSQCRISVEKITLRGEGGGALEFAPGSPDSCEALTRKE